jgi:hypothetical protein
MKTAMDKRELINIIAPALRALVEDGIKVNAPCAP